MNFSISLTINGERRDIELDDPRVTLLDLLRERLDLTGTKKGCDRGQCGACTVLVNGRRINSCLALAVSHDGAEITTIEGLAEGDALHPVQAAFIAHDGFQCGFCTPGQIMSAVGLIEEGQAGDDPERIREGMSGNLCRCGAYAGITEAVLEARKSLPKPNRRARHEALRLCQAGDRCGGGRGRCRARLGLSRRRHQSARPDEGRRQPARPSRRYHASCRASTASNGCPTAAFASARSSATPTSPTTRISRAPIRPWPKRCCPARRRSFATRRPSAAISCSGRAAPTSMMSRAPATGASPARVATRCDGENRLHAVLGWSEPCIATHPSDFCVPLVALDAVVEIEGQQRPARDRARRAAPAARRHARAGDRARARRSDRRAAPAGRRARLRAACALSEAARAHVLRFCRRLGRRGAEVEGGSIREARIALGGVAAKPWRARAAEGAGGRRSRRAQLSAAPPKRRSPTRSRPATTPSRSNSRTASSYARSRSPRQERRSACPPFRPLPSRPSPERIMRLRPASPALPPISGTAPMPASR